MNHEITALRLANEELAQQNSDLTRLLIAAVKCMGGNVSIPIREIIDLENDDHINVDASKGDDEVKLWITKGDAA